MHASLSFVNHEGGIIGADVNKSITVFRMAICVALSSI
jgi:hypothetical protein